MKRILNQMRLAGLMTATTNNSTVKFGVVEGYDPDTYSCKVMLQPNEVMTGWLPISTEWSGNGWGLFAPPSIGDMVDVHFQEGDPDSGYVSRQYFNDVERPVHVESGEFFLIHKSGSALKFNNDGSVDLIAHTDLRATVGGDLTADVTGKATITANKADVNGGGMMAGCINGLSVCHFTGSPMADVSTTVRVSK